MVAPKEYGPEYAMNEDIVLVTVNYRLGVFGFLATEDGVIPGNLGLKDQGWIRKHFIKMSQSNRVVSRFFCRNIQGDHGGLRKYFVYFN